jgi:hypothetical protein
MVFECPTVLTLSQSNEGTDPRHPDAISATSYLHMLTHTLYSATASSKTITDEANINSVLYCQG